MKRYIVAAFGLAGLLSVGAPEASAQWGNRPPGTSIVPGVGLISSGYCQGSVVAPAGYYASGSGTVTATNSVPDAARRDPDAPPNGYGGRVAAWVPGGGQMTSRTIPAQPLIANTGNTKPGASNNGPSVAGTQRAQDDLAIAAARALAGGVGMVGRGSGFNSPLIAGAIPPATGSFPPGSAGQPTNPNLPYYANYGYGNNYFTPTYPSYAPYAQPGSNTGGYPVPSVTYPGGVVMQQAGGGSSPYSFTPASVGYPSYSNNAAYYGQGMTSVSMPGYVTYGQNSHAALTPPGYYANYLPTPTINYNMGSSGSVGGGSGSYYAPMAPAGRGR